MKNLKGFLQSCNKSLINQACSGPYWENISPRSFLYGPRCARSVLSRPRADILPVRPSRLVNKIYVFLRAVPYFDEPVGRVKIQTTSKNTQRYYTTKRLIRDLLSNPPNWYVYAGEFRRYLFTGNAWQKYAKRNGIGAGNPANWLVNSSRARQTGFCSFDHAITGAMYLIFSQREKIVFRSSKLHINSSFSL